MFRMCSLVGFVLLLSFSSLCSSLKVEGVDFLKSEDFTTLKAVRFRRKTIDLHPPRQKNRPLAEMVRPSPSTQLSPKHKSTEPSKQKHNPLTINISPSPKLSPNHVSYKSKTVTEPQKRPSTQDVSLPPSANTSTPRKNSDSNAVLVGCVTGLVLLLILLACGLYFFKRKAGKPVNPWRSGLSGQLQKAFVTGIPALKRSEVEAACEDFSNVIGACPIGKMFKGTLSSGVEIAVASLDTTSAKDWKENTEIHFRKKIEMLSKINHKNFVNLLGYCEEKEPFTRILIFEYAPNGSLSEHLHCKESEHLNWRMRLRIAMGLAYCLDHMHKLNPPVAHTNLVSSSLQLTEDYAVKLADFSFGPSETETSISELNPENNVYSFGLLLFEMITGKLAESVSKPDSVDTSLVDFLRGEPLANLVDPTLESHDVKIKNIGEVIKSCIRTDPKERPTMREVTGWLRDITGISPNDATPQLSPLWWTELEVFSMA